MGMQATHRTERRGAAAIALAALLLAALLGALLAGGCARLAGEPKDAARDRTGVFLYLTCTRKPATGIRFQLSGLRFMAKDGTWTDCPLERLVDAEESHAGQVLLAETPLPRGTYVRMAWRFGGAWVADARKSVALVLPDDGTTETAVDLAVPPDGRTAFFAEWDPDQAVVDSYRFEPRFRVQGQRMAMTDVQAFVACAGSDVVMVLDREQDAVAAVIGVGRGPVGVAADPARNRVYVANAGSGNISVIDAAAGRVVATLPNAGCSPTDLALSADGKWLLAVNPDADNVSVFDTSVLSLVRQITVEREPAGITADPGRGLFYVASAAANTVAVLDPTRAEPVRTLRVGLRPTGLAVLDSVLYVANTGSDNISVVEPPSFAVATTIPAPGAPTWVAPCPADRLCVAGAGADQVSLVYAPTRMVLKTLPGGRGPGRMAADLERRKLFVANEDSAEVAVLDLVSGRVRAVLPVGRQPRGVAVPGQ